MNNSRKNEIFPAVNMDQLDPTLWIHQTRMLGLIMSPGAVYFLHAMNDGV